MCIRDRSNTDDVKKDPENEISDVNTDGTLKYDKKCVCALDVKEMCIRDSPGTHKLHPLLSQSVFRLLL